MVPVPKDGALVYGETFVFDVAPGHAGELRVQLFKKREGLVADAKAVVANAGVYVKNIVTHITAHGAIDKDFKLFSKGGEASGGFVRLRVAYEAIADDTNAGETVAIAAAAGEENADPANAANAAAAKIQASWKGKKTREVTRESLSRKKNAGHKTGPLSPASVAKACGVVAVAAFAASVGVARGRRRRSGFSER